MALAGPGVRFDRERGMELCFLTAFYEPVLKIPVTQLTDRRENHVVAVEFEARAIGIEFFCLAEDHDGGEKEENPHLGSGETLEGK